MDLFDRDVFDGKRPPDPLVDPKDVLEEFEARLTRETKRDGYWVRILYTGGLCFPGMAMELCHGPDGDLVSTAMFRLEEMDDFVALRIWASMCGMHEETW